MAPTANCFSTSRSWSSCDSAISRVARICLRNEASRNAGVAMFPVSEALCFAAAYSGRFGLFGLRFFGVEVDRGSIRRAIVRTDRATRQEGGSRDRHPSAERNEFVHLFSLGRLAPFFGASPTTSARTASRNWRCALASPAEPL